jgi:hypothetical protein
MKSLMSNEKELVLDYFLGIASDEQQSQAKELLKTNPGAAQLFNALDGTLKPLKHYVAEDCPEHLAASTVERLKAAKWQSQVRLETLLQAEASKTVKSHNWNNFWQLAAAAAMIVVVVSASIPALTNARYKYWQTKCSAQLASIAHGIDSYAADHGKELPNVAMTAGSPWWKVGDQGQENVSNTRHLWLLVKNGYAEPECFVCPARIQGKAVKLDRTQVPKLNDFPNRKYVTYSFRVFCNADPRQMVRGNKVLISDLNPIFENLPVPGSELNIKITEQMLRANSLNHRGQGQNVQLGLGGGRQSQLLVSNKQVTDQR